MIHDASRHRRRARRLALALGLACGALLAEPVPTVPPEPAVAPATASLGLLFEKAINRRDRKALEALIDTGAMADRAWRGMAVSPLQSAALRRGSAEGLTQVARTLIDTVEEERGHAFLRKSVPGKDGTVHLLRITFLDTEGDVAGLEYLSIVEGPDGLARDWFSHGQGEWMSRRAGTVLRSMSGLGAGVQGLLGLREFDADALRTLQRFGGQWRSGDAARAFRTLEELPAAFRDTRSWASLRVNVASQLDEATRRASLQHLHDRHGDAADLQFALIDLHVLNGEPRRAVAALARFEREVAEDGHTNRMRCALLLEAGETNAAEAACRRAIALEPWLEDSWWLLAQVGLDQRDPPVVLEALDGLEGRFGYAFDPTELLRGEPYGWLKGTTHFKAWAAPRRLRNVR